MKIGVAIPCFINHINACYRLLDSIDKQTRLPDQVIVSCSSSKATDFVQKNYKFPLRIIITETRQNAALNRYIAASNLQTDTICFFDADDIMHPQRLEAIEAAFQGSANIILHSFLLNEECSQEFPVLSTFDIQYNILKKCYSGCITFNQYDNNKRLAHGHVSVTRAVFEQVKFPIESEYETREDCVFCHRAFSLPSIQSGYIPYPLSKYIPSRTGETEKGI
jgi:glycosyltransferase involved in cell wall biosynthesis